MLSPHLHLVNFRIQQYYYRFTSSNRESSTGGLIIALHLVWHRSIGCLVIGSPVVGRLTTKPSVNPSSNHSSIKRAACLVGRVCFFSRTSAIPSLGDITHTLCITLRRTSSVTLVQRSVSVAVLDEATLFHDDGTVLIRSTSYPLLSRPSDSMQTLMIF